MNLLLNPMRKKLFHGAVAIYDPYRDITGENILPVNADNFVTGWVAYGSASAGVYKRNILPANADDFAASHGWSAYSGASVSISRRNILPAGADNFVTGWLNNAGGTVTVTPGQPDPDGGNNAYRIQHTGTTSKNKYYITVGFRTNPHTDTVSCYIRVLSGNAKLTDWIGDEASPATDEWARYSVTIANYAATNGSIMLSTDAAADILDILVYQPMINSGNTVDDYVPPQTGYPDTDGGNNAYRIITSGGASAAKYILASGITSLTGIPYSHQLRLKCLNGVGVKVADNFGHYSSSYSDTEWHLANPAYATGDGSALNFWIYASIASDALDFLAYHPMANVGTATDDYVSPQTGYPDPDGGSGAYRIITVGGSSTLKYVSTVSAVAGPHQCTKSVWIKKAIAASNVYVSTEGDVFWAPVTENWGRVINNIATDTAGTGLRFVTNLAANATDFYVYHPMINFGADAAPYVIPSGLPVALTDFSGKKNFAQLGSTAIADTNDPAWAANALVFGGDDYVLCGRPAALEAARPFCIYGVAYINSSTNSESPIAKNSASGSGTGNKGFLLVKDNVNPGSMGFAVFDTSGTLNYLWSDGTVATGWHYFFIGWDGAKKYLKIDGAMKSSNQATYAADNTVSLYLGRYAHNTAGYFTGREAIVIPCSKFHSPAEEQRNYNYLKRLLAARGIAI